MADLGTLALGAFANVNDTDIQGTDPVLEVIASTDDADYVFDNNNGTHTGEASFALADTPVDFGSMDSVSIRLRYGLGSALSNNTWDSLTAIIRDAAGNALTDEVTLASSITTTTPTNSSAVAFTRTQAGIDADKATWDGATVRIRFSVTRTKGGDSAEERVYAAEVTGAYTVEIASQTLTPAPVTAAFSAPDPGLTLGPATVSPDPVAGAMAVPAPVTQLGALTVTPDAVAAAWSSVAPSLDVGTVVLTPDAVAAALAVPAPSLDVGGVTLAPDPAAAAWDVSAPTLNEGGEQIVSPDPVTGAWSVLAPSLVLGEVVLVPSPVVAALAVASPSLIVGALDISPDPVTGAWATPVPVILLGEILLAPSPVAAAWGVGAPSLVAGPISLLPDPVVAAWSVPAPSVVGPLELSPDPILAAWGVFAPSIDGGEPLPGSQGRRRKRKLVHVAGIWGIL